MDRPTPQEPPSRLQQRLADGEPAAFAELFELYGERLYRCARRWTADHDGAEDAVQELFVSLARSRQRLASIDDLTAYLFTSLRRCAQRETVKRRQERLGAAASSLADIEPTPAAAAESSSEQTEERRARLAQALARLPEEQREVITLKWDGELTFAQIAAILAVSPNTAASRYRYAVEKLRQWLCD